MNESRIFSDEGGSQGSASLLFSPRGARVNGGDKQRDDTLPDQLHGLMPHEGTIGSPRSVRKSKKSSKKGSKKTKKDETMTNPLSLDDPIHTVEMQPSNIQLFSEDFNEQRDEPIMAEPCDTYQNQEGFHTDRQLYRPESGIQQMPRSRTALQSQLDVPGRSINPESSAPVWEPSREPMDPLETFGSGRPEPQITARENNVNE